MLDLLAGLDLLARTLSSSSSSSSSSSEEDEDPDAPDSFGFLTDEWNTTFRRSGVGVLWSRIMGVGPMGGGEEKVEMLVPPEARWSFEGEWWT